MAFIKISLSHLVIQPFPDILRFVSTFYNYNSSIDNTNCTISSAMNKGNDRCDVIRIDCLKWYCSQILNNTSIITLLTLYNKDAY